MKIIRYADYIETPWKNGGGVTHEIARSDESGEPDWRISLATIDRDGPFSDFTGYDRTIVPLDGAGFELSFDDGRVVVLERAGVPFRFAGEGNVQCRLLGGRSRDLNAMTRRARWQHDVTAIALTQTATTYDAPAQSYLFFLGAAAVVGNDAAVGLGDGDTLACREAARLELRAASETSMALSIRFTPRA